MPLTYAGGRAWISPGDTIVAGAVPVSGSVASQPGDLKLFPPLSEETESLSRPAPSAMMICVGLKFPIAEPFTVALLKVTGLKCASGRTPLLDDGASAMTSADELAAPLSDALIVWLQPLVVSLRTSV